MSNRVDKIWTVYDDTIEQCEREIRQLEILISIEHWRDINERLRKSNIDNLNKQLRKLKRELNKNVKLKSNSI